VPKGRNGLVRILSGFQLLHPWHLCIYDTAR
jgi:hypothetical protein